VNRPLNKILMVSSIFLSLLLPLFIRDPYYLHILNISFLTAIGVYALNIITGFTGQLNIAHAGFIGVGAYVSALATTHFSVSFWASLPLAGFAAGVCGFLVGYPALRVRGIYFALTTLAFG